MMPQLMEELSYLTFSVVQSDSHKPSTKTPSRLSTNGFKRRSSIDATISSLRDVISPPLVASRIFVISNILFGFCFLTINPNGSNFRAQHDVVITKATKATKVRDAMMNIGKLIACLMREYTTQCKHVTIMLQCMDVDMMAVTLTVTCRGHKPSDLEPSLYSHSTI